MTEVEVSLNHVDPQLELSDHIFEELLMPRLRFRSTTWTRLELSDHMAEVKDSLNHVDPLGTVL